MCVLNQYRSHSFVLSSETLYATVFIIYLGLPRQAEVAQGVPGRLRPGIFLTFRHHKDGRSSAKRTGRLYPGRNLWYPLSEAESTSGHMFLSGYHGKSPVTPLGIDPGTSRLVAQRLNHHATPGPICNSVTQHNSIHCRTSTRMFRSETIIR